MEKIEITSEQLGELVDRIFPVLAEKGPAHTTMDLLAKRLSMSKRTLYEIFGSKDDMIRTVMEHLHNEYLRHLQEIYKRSDNMMEIMANVMIYHQQTMSKLSANFFRDMDERCNHLRGDYESNSMKWVGYIREAIDMGVRQGVFRKDSNYNVIIPLIRVQMESLKRIEEFFPPGITMVEAYNAIALGFLRSIATPSGMDTLDRLAGKFGMKATDCPTYKDNINNNINDKVTKE
jgi:AcrR family transcriptional regulator